MSPATRSIVTLFRNDLRILLRSRRTLIMSVLLPLLVWPVMLLISRASAERQEEKLETTDYAYAVVGAEAQFARRLIEEVRTEANGEGSEEFRFEEVEVEDPVASLESGEVHFYLEALSPEQAAERLAEEAASDGAPSDEASEGLSSPSVPVLNLYFRADRDTSRAGQERIRHGLEEVATKTREALLLRRGFPIEPSHVARLEETDVATAAQSSGLRLGRFLTVFLMMFLLSGGAVVATDSLAGEKERGTLETLLTTALSRFEIVVAKQLAILAVAVVITVLQVLNLLVYVGFNLIPLPENFSIAVSPQVAALLLLLFLPVASLVSSVLLLVSGYAKTYKEAQLYFFPVFMLGLMPTLAPFLPGIELRSAIVLVPVANISVAVKEILVGTFDWPMIGLAWLTTVAAAAYAARLSARALSTERLITASDVDAAEFVGGSALFPRHVLRWFAVMWALLLLAGNALGAADVRYQLLVNFSILLAGSLLMLRKYRLRVSEALALRAVRPRVWLAVVVGVPSALVVGNGVYRLANLVFPVPERLLDSLAETLLPEELPMWQILVFLCVLPGIIEEIAFRGMLLHGLRRRFHPALLPLVVGLVFGLYHVALFRILPTAFLGVTLAVVTLLTGSILPAMLWHVLNNALALLVASQFVELEQLETWHYFLGAGLFTATFWVLWHYRTPYPGLRRSRAPA